MDNVQVIGRAVFSLHGNDIILDPGYPGTVRQLFAQPVKDLVAGGIIQHSAGHILAFDRSDQAVRTRGNLGMQGDR